MWCAASWTGRAAAITASLTSTARWCGASSRAEAGSREFVEDALPGGLLGPGGIGQQGVSLSLDHGPAQAQAQERSSSAAGGQGPSLPRDRNRPRPQKQQGHVLSNDSGVILERGP